jgi:phenylalanyl-tRNA synthetase alpha chain
MQDNLNKIKKDFQENIISISDNDALQRIKTKYIGRKEGLVTLLFDDLRNWDIEKKKEFGGPLNSLKKEIETAILEKEQELGEKSSYVDLSVPALKLELGHLHPISKLQKEIEDIFFGIGFDIELGPEIDSDHYNFETLNIPENHPARDMQDTFYVDLEHPKKHPGRNLVLRTHISNMQVRYMEKHTPPFAVILPGRVFRNEAVDASHEHTYQYMEGFVVGKNISYANMAWTLDYAMKEVFGKEVQTKLLPSYFPFVEPGAEGFISCVVCKGKGCSVCKQTGWVEVFGCGMIHQKVFEAAGYKAGEYTGFAFGFGLSRLALMKYSIPDIRLFAENDLRFLNQF